MNEFELIRQFFSNISHADGVELGVGDDAAVLRIPEGERLVVSVDTLVEQVHFPQHYDPADLARRCLRVNLSDLAAMGAKPRWFTLALTLPEMNPEWLTSFARGLALDAATFGVSLVGGDTTRGPLTIGIQIMGSASDVLRRDGANAGDIAAVTGRLGAAAAYIESLADNTHPPATQDALYQRFWLPSPRVALGQTLVGLASAACDISDGLMGDIGHICRSSDLSVVLNVDAVPAHSALDPARRDLPLTGGDDYELCLAIAPSHWSRAREISAQHGVELTQVGMFLAADGAPEVSTVDGRGQGVAIANTSYQHF